MKERKKERYSISIYFKSGAPILKVSHSETGQDKECPKIWAYQFLSSKGKESVPFYQTQNGGKKLKS